MSEATAELVQLRALQQHPRNSRRHLTRAAVLESLGQHGQYRPLIVQRSTGFVLAGNGLLAAMTERQDETAWVWWADVDDDEALRILLVDNATSDGSGYDDDHLAKLLNELAASSRGLIGTGFGLQQLGDLQQMLATPLTAQQLVDKHGTQEDDDTWWPTLRVRVPQKVLERYGRLADLTKRTDPAQQLRIIVAWAERGRPKG